MLHEFLPLLPQFFVLFLHLAQFDVFAHLPRPVTDVGDGDVIDHPPAPHLAIGAFDKPILVDPRVAGERGNEPDVGTLRRLNGADATVVSGVDVADFESGSLAGKAPRSEGRQTPLVGDFRKRVGLVHKLRELGRAEEFPNRGHHRLGVDQVVGHSRRHFLVNGHLFFDRPFHAHQADTELVLQQLAHRPNAPIAEVVDIVHGVAAAGILAQLQEVTNGGVEILRVQCPLVQGQLYGRVFGMVRGQRALATPYHF